MSKYVDTPAIVQVIGNIYLDPSLLDREDKYSFNEDDFPEEFHKILFGSIYNLHQLGAKEITLTTIEDYLEQRPKKMGVYKANHGAEYLTKISQGVQKSTFNYYYNRMKKMTLLRMYDKAGLDLKWIYDPDNILDAKKKQAQEDWIDNTSLEDIALTIDRKITDIRLKYVDNANDDFVSAGDGALSLIDALKQHPEVGYPLYGKLVNAIHRGARLKKFYLRSASTGVGKTRSMIADACFVACDRLYDSQTSEWAENNTKEPVIFITTEQEVSEIQTMALAFISDVDEEHILTGDYLEGEYERVLKAADILTKSCLMIKELPDFSLQDIENTIKYGIREFHCRYVFLDYIHSSMKILSEISSKAGVKGLREDNILFMMSVKLKDLCNEYGVFIESATQLNGDFRDAKVFDQNLLRGAKSLADKIDIGEIMLPVSKEDKEILTPLLQKTGYKMPDTKISVYKNRRGRYKDVLIWCTSRKEVCKIDPQFVTNYNYELLDIEDLKINITPRMQASSF